MSHQRDGSIRAGDLVMVVRTHCPQTSEYLGRPFIVAKLVTARGVPFCDGCHQNMPTGLRLADDGGDYHFPLSWLLKIDPDSTEETRDEAKELTTI